MSVIVVIPARGGSKGIPRKNLRPVGGKPLIYYSIIASLNAELVEDVLVSTDDDEIALFAQRFGAKVLMRDPKLADDQTTLDPVIQDAVKRYSEENNKTFDYVVTVQPTSPLVRSLDIDSVITTLKQTESDTVVSVVDDRHLCWTVIDGKAVPAYKERVNRQKLPPNFKETGAVIACTLKQILLGTRIGSNVSIYQIPVEFSFDIDSYSDLYLCESILSRKKIVFTVVGYPAVGLGHAYRAVMLAHELVQFDLLFVCDSDSELAADYIRSQNYTAILAKPNALAETVLDLKPHLVVNDVLDTDVPYMKNLKSGSFPIVNFEDMGEGRNLADYVINALYPDLIEDDQHLVGEKYFCLRDEFLYLEKEHINRCRDNVSRLLITFGGVDEGNLTVRTLNEVAETCIENNIDIEIITGPGYQHGNSLDSAISALPNLNVKVVSKTKRISEHMCSADFAITSGGRTVLELASLKVPMIVICQNERETTHTFASEKNGVKNLGHHKVLDVGKIKNTFISLVDDAVQRKIMISKMEELNLSEGKNRVISIIKSLLN